MAGGQEPIPISTKQARIAQLAKQMPGVALRSLSHRIDLEWLRAAFERTRKDGAVEVDGVTATMYAKNLDANLRSLLDRVKSGAYRAPPVKRTMIPKGDGSKTRPIGIPTFEDKVVQRAFLMLLEPVFEEDFYDFSYGFRPCRSAHDALKVLNEGLHRMGGGWVLDVDISSFFDTLDHAKLRDLLKQRISDGVVLRMVGKWLRAGVLEGGVVRRLEAGTPQGGVISPLLANVYLHEVLDGWWCREVEPRLLGPAFLVRYADDFVIVFSNQKDALRVNAVLAQRFARFGLTLHPEKTRLVYHRPPIRPSGSPTESFDFLGFTHYWARSRKGRWIPKRKTAKSRFARATKALNEWLRKARHWPIEAQHATLVRKLKGHFNYYGLIGNSRALNAFRTEAQKLWRRWLSRRSQRGFLPWQEFRQILHEYPLPPARLCRKARLEYGAITGEPVV